MDNFKPINRRVAPSIDGFIPNKKSTGKPQNRNSGSFNQYYRPKNTGSAPGRLRNVGAFNKSVDGFTSSSQSVISHTKKEAQSVDLMDSFSLAEEQSVEKMGGFGASVHTTKPSKASGKPAKTGLFKRRSEKKPKSKKRKIIKRTMLLAGAFVLLLGGGLLIRGILIGNSIFKGGGNSALLHGDDVDPSLLNGEGDGRINILMLGKGGVEQTDGPNLTDTIIVASIDPIADEAALLSIPRDFWVKSGGYASKINEVYANAKMAALNSYSYQERDSGQAKDAGEKAGIEAIKKVVTETMGIPIHYYAMIDFAGFRKAIDTVGGIDINVTKDMVASERMRINGRSYILDVREGRQHFDGFRALAYSRSRKAAGSDFARAERQRAIIVGLKDKVMSTGTLANPIKLNQLMSDFSGQLVTDFSVNEMLRLYDITKDISGDKVESVALRDFLRDDWMGGAQVLVPKEGTFVYDEIQAYVRGVMRDAFLKQEDAKVMILNGTETPGLATKMSSELKSFGYNIKGIDDAPTKDYANTTLVDLRAGINKYTRSYLERRLGVTATTAIPDASIEVGEADFIIIIGQNRQ